MLTDVRIIVGKLCVPADFIVIDMEEDDNISIILGHPFFATCNAKIDIKKGEISMAVGGK